MKPVWRIDTEASQYIANMNTETFQDIALELFRYQYAQNKVYRDFVRLLHVVPEEVKELINIPFLPVSFFKTHQVITGSFTPQELCFESSGTTGEHTSKHFLQRKDLYEAAALRGFEDIYGSPSSYAILALLPSYLERKNSSLVYMAQMLMQKSGKSFNGFYLHELDKLAETLKALEAQKQPTILIGVTFALLDFAKEFPMKLNNTIVMETGGMKGRRSELTRTEVHQFLKQQWNLSSIHSEYGMTELLSQAYAVHDGIFRPAASMKIFVRDLNDPLDVKTSGSGAINVIDLANVDSCAFIATEDMGILEADGSFEVMGRMDHAVLRGCSLMTV